MVREWVEHCGSKHSSFMPANSCNPTNSSTRLRAPCVAVCVHEVGKHYQRLEGRGAGHAFPVEAS